MKVWSAIFNIFAVLMLLILLLVYYNICTTNERQFQELKLKKAVEYSAEAAFRTTLEVEDIDIEYSNIGSVVINPGNCLDIFESMMCLNYNITTSEENKKHIESYVPTAVLACNDGYYIATDSEIDTTPTNGVIGKEWGLKWSVKKPYSIKIGNNLYAFNLNNNEWTSVRISGTTIDINTGVGYPTGINEERIIKEVNSKITNDMLFQIDNRNINRLSENYKFYLPPIQTSDGTNPITKPSLLVFMQGVDFANTNRLDTICLAGLKTTRKKIVIAYTYNGSKYYCYEGQLSEDLMDYVDNYYANIDEAAEDGYMPNYDLLQKKINYD